MGAMGKIGMWRRRVESGLRNRLDARRDRAICGMSLETFAPALDGGAVDTISAPYGTLERVLGPEEFAASDRLLDVGCGMGRPLAYLAGRGFPGELFGIELNGEVAREASRWAERYPNVRIMAGDAFGLDLSRFNRLFMWYPMVPEVLARFVGKLEREAREPVTVYYVGNIGGGVFEGRPGWSVRRQGSVYRVHGIPQHANPTRYYVLEYAPA